MAARMAPLGNDTTNGNNTNRYFIAHRILRRKKLMLLDGSMSVVSVSEDKTYSNGNSAGTKDTPNDAAHPILSRNRVRRQLFHQMALTHTDKKSSVLA